jgi:hypothetical protein
MNKERAKELLPVITAFAEGKKVRTRDKGTQDEWIEIKGEPSWYPNQEYDVMPEPKYVPFTFEDAEVFVGKTVIAKDKSCGGVITYFNKSKMLIGVFDTKYNVLLRDYLFLNGSPCGKLE